MRILYYLEPWIEMGWPGFRFGSLQGYLHKEIAGLIDQGNEVMLVIGDGLEQEAKQKNFNLSRFNFKVIRQKHLRKVFSDYYTASNAWYSKTYSPEQETKMCSLVKDVVEGFDPDVVVSWESPIPFMEKAYPNAAILYSNYGALSRHPFPATQAYDFHGLFKDSYLGKGLNAIDIPRLNADQSNALSCFRAKVKKAFSLHNPFEKMDLSDGGKYKKTILLPLQVSGYYAFDSNVPFKSQFDYLCSVLELVPEDIRVVVTEHNSFSSIFNNRTLGYLKGRYPHFFYHDKFSEVKGSSQYLLEMVDAVVGVTSSVLLQAVIMDKPVKVIGDSHIDFFSSEHGLHRAERIVNRYNSGRFDKFIYHLMTRYWFFQESDSHNGKWLSSLMEEVVCAKQKGNLNSDFYLNREVDDLRVMKRLIDSVSFDAPQFIKRKKALSIRENTIMARRSSSSQPSTLYKNTVEAIHDSDWVSFDIFDTLVKRTVSRPSDVFTMVGERMVDILRVSADTFKHARITAERKVRSDSKLEEVTVDEIYQELNRSFGLSEERLNSVLACEVQTECEVCIKRASGIELLDIAEASRKKVLLISDMYLRKSHILAILSANNISIDPSCVYVSSEERLQKHSGNLFSHVLFHEGLNASGGVHIGDHPNGDGSKPKELGINAIVIPKVMDKLKKNKSFSSLLKQTDANLSASVTAALISNRLYDRADKSVEGLSTGSLYGLGYTAMGPLLLGFAAWLKEDASKRGIQDLYFLARDGKVMKQAYDLYCSYTGGGARSHYMYASRRSINVPCIERAEQIYEILKAPFASCPLKSLLESRFGLSAELIPEEISSKIDLERVTSPHDSDLVSVFEAFEGLILSNAKAERVALDKYIQKVGIGAPNQAIVDIGYRGSMQESLSRITGQHLHGYYWATKDEIGTLPASGYLGNKVNKREKFDLWQGVALAEWLTLDGDTSVVKFDASEDKVTPIFGPQQNHDLLRASMTKDVHEAAFEFIKDWFKSPNSELVPDLDTVKSTYFELLARPGLNDVHLLESVVLEDSYGGHLERKLIEPIANRVAKSNLDQVVRASAWKGGARVLVSSYKPTEESIFADSSGSEKLTNVIPKANQRKFKKLLREPYWFFYDSQNRFFRPFRHFFRAY
ncbi:hypothetical protein [Aliagarivorans marinus]|uniref:capsular polysaccharide export protein, LipB/KpsS family n=1 Tax=Aliagarivorans marinus TaxID=561965 RepID=UPI00041786B1|nr:hypothetical protein [Aliagarivorans marinus]